jgi:putative ABC transport system substrate-binding protein
MVIGEDPVEVGIVASLAHPGGRVTGIAFRTLEGDAKRLELLREAIPTGRRFGYLGMSYESVARAKEMAEVAARLGIEVTTYWVNGPSEYAAAFARMRNEGVAGVVVGATQPLAANASRVAASAAENRLPTICEWDYMARVGCVLGFGHDLTYGQRRVGEYLARILKGTPPSELPIEESDAWKLTVNLRVAAKLGITMSPSILARADEVIE